MSDVTLTSESGLSESYSFRDWQLACLMAIHLGWEPQGTRVDGAGPYWCGHYIRDGYHGVYITEEDAAAIAEALSRPALEAMPNSLFRSVAQVCSSGLVKLGDSEVMGYCHCESWRRESLPFEDLELARKAAWEPKRDFDSYMVWAAVRAQLHERCWARHLETREGLAQAICGYLDRHPQDAALADPDLMGAVEPEFYAGWQLRPANTWIRSQQRDNGAYLMLANARERRGLARPVSTALPVLATEGPWWRAARVLGDCDVALIAAGVEWLYQRRDEYARFIDARFETFAPGEDPPRARIPALDFNWVQKDIFGLDERRWPVQSLAAYEELTIAEAHKNKASIAVGDRDEQ